MRLFVVRHGETEYNRNRKMQGYQEIPLNDRGIAQAAQLAKRLASENIDHILCSDLRRAVMTGCIVAARTGASMSYDAGLRERDPGELVEQSYDVAPQFFWDVNYVPPGGESVPDFRARVRSAFTRIREEFEGKCGTLVVVAHGHVCHAFVDEFFGSAYSDGVGTANAAITIARLEGGEWTLEQASCTAHLKESPAIAVGDTIQELQGS
jgi:2,3-bisphosphoglycerate-dependent phosphoglycerate mutase